jgi:hypothetical protein
VPPTVGAAPGPGFEPELHATKDRLMRINAADLKNL